MEPNEAFSNGINTTGDTWYVDNYVLLKDYYDRTISRVAARCVRKGNIAIEEYEQYGYILDLLEEICETGEYILAHRDLYNYVEKKIPGGINALQKNLSEFKTELKNNASPDMIKQDKEELERMKAALGAVDKSVDPTVGAGMSMDQVVEKLMQKQGGQTLQPNSKPQNAPRPQQGQNPNQALRSQQPQHPQQTNQPQRPFQQTQQQPSGNQPRPAQSQQPTQSPFNNGVK